MPSRRNLLIALGGSAAASGVAFGTGAFDQVSATRTASVKVVGDADGYLGLEANGRWANNNNEELKLTFNKETDANGTGLNQNADITFENVFTITNQSSQSITLSYFVDPDETSQKTEVSDVTHSGVDSIVFTSESKDTSFGGTLPTGHSINVNVRIDTGKGTKKGDIPIEIGTESDVGGGSSASKPVNLVGGGRYDTISSALSAAGKDDTISVTQGKTFSEGLNVETDGITLKDKSGAATIKSGPSDRNTISVNADDVTVDGFTIEGKANDGAQNLGAVVRCPTGGEYNGLTLKNSTIILVGDDEDITQGGVISGGTTTIKNTTFLPEFNGSGLPADGDYENTPFGYAIKFTNTPASGGSEVTNCTIGPADSDGVTIRKGIYAINTGNIDIEKTTIRNLKEDGIYLSLIAGRGDKPDKLENLSIKKNDIKNNASAGVVFDGIPGQKVNINKNNITGNQTGISPTGLNEGAGGDPMEPQNLQSIDAKNNYWGPAGPEPVLGNPVIQNAEVVPFLLSPYEEDGEMEQQNEL
jgi:hypothetical protein